MYCLVGRSGYALFSFIFNPRVHDFVEKFAIVGDSVVQLRDRVLQFGDGFICVALGY